MQNYWIIASQQRNCDAHMDVTFHNFLLCPGELLTSLCKQWFFNPKSWQRESKWSRYCKNPVFGAECGESSCLEVLGAMGICRKPPGSH